MAKGSKKAKAKSKERLERRFTPRPTTNPSVVKALGGLGAAALGAGTFAQFGHQLMNSELPPYPFGTGLVAGGALMCGAAVWLGTSGEQVLRVGAGGIAVEKGKEVTRIPWYGIERIVWEPISRVLAIQGTDDMGKTGRLVVSPESHPAAAAWVVKEARSRIPALVDVPDETHGLPEASASAGELLVMDPVQVVGRRCAVTQKIIAYEPDARVCPRCERVYYKLEVPDECACGASLQGMRAAAE